YGADTIYQTYNIPVGVVEPPSELVVTQIEPEEITITLSGQRRFFFLSNEDDVKLILKPWQLKRGATPITLSSSNFTMPEGWTYESVEPRVITITLASKNQTESK
ncbi:MAG: hypothetical protein P8Y80_05625, partial [Acidobacteriota bacterium]